MQKVVDFLENNVQWLVLGLGGLVFLLMVYWYVIQPPVAVEVSGQKLLPGEVDALSAMVKREMEGVYTLKVPLVVDIGTGDNWRDAK